jgi:formylglycine-generating enzyme required for sulfatase activity
MGTVKKWLWVVCVVLATVMAASLATAELAVTNVTVAQRWPWENKVDIRYDVVCDDSAADIHVFFNGLDQDRLVAVKMLTLEGDGASGPVKAGSHHVVWDAGADLGTTFHAASFAVRIEALRGDALYLIVDLSGGPEAGAYPVSFAPNLPDPIPAEYKTTHMAFRYCPPGSFLMGSPADELGRYGDTEDLHLVTLTKPFYIGVFEVTQKQWELVMGYNPSWDTGDTRPVEEVSYDDIRGTDDGAGWPSHNRVDLAFIGKLRQRCNLLIDLPTEAQWEYACRAGTTTALNSGKNLTDTNSCPNMAEVGCYNYNFGSHTAVGSFLPNRWGLFDMHGNVWEWCLDWYTELGKEPCADPVGASTGSRRLMRGGSWYFGAQYCRSANRSYYNPSYRDNNGGFRLAFFPAGQGGI